MHIAVVSENSSFEESRESCPEDGLDGSVCELTTLTYLVPLNPFLGNSFRIGVPILMGREFYTQSQAHDRSFIGVHF